MKHKLPVYTHPIVTFHIIVISVSWIVLTTLFFLHLPSEPGIIVLTYGGLLGISTLLTFLNSGKKGVKKLFAGVIHWRVNIGFYALALLALPALTILVSLIMGSYAIPKEELFLSIQKYFVSVFSGFIIINLWEETGWMGYVQSKLMANKGLLIGSILTAPGFVAVHIPLYFSQPSVFEFFISLGVLILLAFIFRYVLGMVFSDTQNSVLIVGLLHASFNNSAFGHKEMLPASIIATVILTLTYSFVRNRLRFTK